MAYWNKVSPTVLTSTTLDMASPKGQWEHGLLDLLALFRSCQLFCLSWEAVGWLSMWWSRHLLSVYSTIKSSIFNTLFSDDGEELQACIPILPVGTRSGCQQLMTFAVFKAILRGCLHLFVFLFVTVYVYSVRFSNFSNERIIEGRRRPTCSFNKLLLFRCRFMHH